MRRFFVFLGLLLSVISLWVDEQAVIEDSEAIRYVGRYIEVPGGVVSVTTSPLGTAYQFRTRIPKPDVRRVHSG
jgi:hypothetical protein